MVNQKNYEEAVKIFLKTRPTLLRYKDVASISNIYDETVIIMNFVEQELKKIVCGCIISSDKLSEAITLLLKLGVQSSAVYSDFLASCRRNLNDQLSTIQSQKQVSFLGA
ncbi:unnamed protein product [Gongylonema pulchrum]|uniref:Vacuolar protein sorting-associated protein 51 homolog n=1 Tax=Gongylonema pulchrum TaxID=637853 RepID=A0A3P7PDK4_9BILA|nr:unnamed protein product [Gongylonema pulchrum]